MTPAFRTEADPSLRARRDGVLLMMLGGLVFVLLGLAMEYSVPSRDVDFRVVYYPARCLLQHVDPYQPDQVLRLYRAEGGDAPADPPRVRNLVSGYVYLPSAFLFTLPFALLAWGPAHLLWQALILASYLLAAWLIFQMAAQWAPLAAGALIGLLLANSQVLLATSNAAGIVISLCVIAVWSFLRGRFVAAGVVCMAIALAIKPQDAALVWLYFLLAGGTQRKRALQVLLVTVLLSLPTTLWVSAEFPHWPQEWRSIMAATEVRGGTSDPGPASQAGHGLAMVVSLQSALSLLRDDRSFYNPIAYLICAPILLLWGYLTLRLPPGQRSAWLALASISALTMLPVYHRQYDAKLILLTIPACALLFAEGGRVKAWALAVSVAGILITGDLTWTVFFAVLPHLRGLSAPLAMAVQVVPVPLALLCVAVFYLWAYARPSVRASTAGPAAIPR